MDLAKPYPPKRKHADCVSGGGKGLAKSIQRAFAWEDSMVKDTTRGLSNGPEIAYELPHTEPSRRISSIRLKFAAPFTSYFCPADCNLQSSQLRLPFRS